MKPAPSEPLIKVGAGPWPLTFFVVLSMMFTVGMVAYLLGDAFLKKQPCEETCSPQPKEDSGW